jgi:hypothetical protein
MNTQLLITFTKNNRLNVVIEQITKCYTLAFNKIYILENISDSKELVCSYNINTDFNINGDIPLNTISVHRRSDTNTIYTINALNYIISLLNDGKTDSTFSVPWQNYKGMILVTNADGLRKIETKIHSVVKI